MTFSRSNISIFFFLSCWVKNTSAFGVLPFARSSPSTVRLSYSNDASGDLPLDSSRKCVEELFAKSPGQTGFTKETRDLLLTSSSLKTREFEIELLQTLYESDAAVDQLIHLWSTERGQEYSEPLMAVQEQSVECLEREEERLATMTRKFPRWSEPFAQLATLYYYKGQPDQANRYARHALELKPWHIEAPHLLVHISRQANDERQAAHWYNMALPPLTHESKEKRQRWVDFAVTEAIKSLQEAQRVTEEWLRNGERGAFQ